MGNGKWQMAKEEMTNALNSIPANIGDSMPIAIASWLACLAMVMVVGMMIAKVTKEIRGKPVASEVAAETAERFTPKTDFKEHVEWNRREHENLFSKIGGVERGTMVRMDAISSEWRQFAEERIGEIVQSNNQGREKLHERINLILREVGEIRGELKGKSR